MYYIIKYFKCQHKANNYHLIRNPNSHHQQVCIIYLHKSITITYIEIKSNIFIEYSSLKPPRHPQSDQMDQSRGQKIQKRYKNEELNSKVSLPSLPGIKKSELPLQTIVRIPNRLPKLEAKSEIPK